MIYGEIADDSTFRFLSAAMPFPAVFSRAHGRFMEVAPELTRTFPPVGMLPSWDVIDRNTTTSDLGFKDHYQENKWLLMGAGDILLLHTDGLSDHRRDQDDYFPSHLERTLRQVAHLKAREIFEAIKADLLDFAKPTDDVSLVIIKKE
jgi:serine phosphatase RsbU (regulator of sigma subunit)